MKERQGWKRRYWEVRNGKEIEGKEENQDIDAENSARGEGGTKLPNYICIYLSICKEHLLRNYSFSVE